MIAESLSADTSSLLIWDSREEPPADKGIVYRWSGLDETETVRSVMRYAESNDGQLRRKYLAWIHDLGETPIRGKRLIDRFAYDDGFSYWWMTLLVEKDPYKSPITDAIRLLALEEMVTKLRPERLRLVSDKRWLHKTIRDLCLNLEIDFEGAGKSPGKLDLSLAAIYRALPRPVRAVVYLARYAIERRSFRGAPKQEWLGGEESIFICSYLDNFDQQAMEKGKHYSYYWQDLHGLLQKDGYKSNWLHIRVASANVPDSGAAISRIDHINSAQQGRESHNFVVTFLSWRVLLSVLGNMVWLGVVSLRLCGIRKAFRPQGSGLSMWPLMRKDWRDALRGPVAINNLLKIELFDEAIQSLPYQRKGLFLYENQAWERALCHAWRKYGHGQLIAVAHTMVRFWDMRYFADPRTVSSSKPYSMPQPDLIALNGKAAVNAYISADYPDDVYVECEALRYGHLNDMQKPDETRQIETVVTRVLVLGDYLQSGTAKLLGMLEAAIPYISDKMDFTIKPHPNCKVDKEEYLSLDLEVVMDPLGEILHRYDCAYCGALTSAALDAHLAGLPVVVKIDDDELNFSPLRGIPGIKFVGAAEELAEALEGTERQESSGSAENDFFFLDPELAKWSRILAS